jgi:hypothetical protein
MFGSPEVNNHQTYSARDWLSILRTPYPTQNLQRNKEGEQLEDRRNVGGSSCNSEDGTDQKVQSLMFMMMMMILFDRCLVTQLNLIDVIISCTSGVYWWLHIRKSLVDVVSAPDQTQN